MTVFGIFLVCFFTAFRLRTEIYRVKLRIQSECGKIRIRKTANTDTFHAVPTLFYAFVSDLYLAIDDIGFASYADDNTVYYVNEYTDNAFLLLLRKFFTGFLLINFSYF